MLLILLTPLASCAPKTFDDPLAVMTSRQNDPAERERAAEQAARQMPRDPRRIAALHKLVWEPRYPQSQRRYAIDELIQIDEAEFRRVLARRIVLIQNWETLDYIFKLAVERHWTDFTPTLVRQYARTAPGPDAERPERAVLEKLNPGKTVEQVVFEVFANADDKVPADQQVAAWELLNRITNKERLIALLAQAPNTTPMVADLKASAADLHALPSNKEGVLWLASLRDPSHRADWDATRAKVSHLTDPQRTGLELRHMPFLRRADAATLATTRSSLVADIQGQLSGAEHHLKAPTFDGQAKDYPQSFYDWMDKMSWGDLVVVRSLLAAMRDPRIVAALFTQADADHEDTSTEYGGGLFFDGEGPHLIARLYKPLTRVGDIRYLPPPELIESLYNGAAHYHFHAQETRNSEYAGPGRGDLKFADTLNFNCLVFTFIDHDKLNVDYYQRGGVVVDLGTLRR